MMTTEYPLYPELTEQGKEEAQRILDSFKPKIASLVNEILGEIYKDVVFHIESDSWINYRNQLMDGFKGYTDGRKAHSSDFKELRQAIYNNHKGEIIKDLNQDLVEENKRLAEEVDRLRELRQERWR